MYSIATQVIQVQVFALYIVKWFIKKHKLFQPMLYEYNLGSYWIHSLQFNFLVLRIVNKMNLQLK